MAYGDDNYHDEPSKVCVRCKGRKKKCDRSLPSCGRCTRLNVRCANSRDAHVQLAAIAPTYADGSGDDSISLPQNGYNPSSSLLPQIISRNTFMTNLPSLDRSLIHVLRQGDHRILDFDEQYNRLVHDIISNNGDTIESCLMEYFKKYEWYPILSKAQMVDGLGVVESSPKAELADLILCVYLMTQTSRRRPGHDERLQQLYHTTKGLHCLLLSTGRESIELVQAGLLVALFENSQGLHNAAYSSVGACARMGYILGLNKALSPDSKIHSRSPAVVQTERRVWWGVVILERYLFSLARKFQLHSKPICCCIKMLISPRIVMLEHIDKRLPFASQTPDSYDLLPSDGNMNIQVANDLDLPAHEGFPSISGVSMSPYPQIAQIVYLLSLVIDNMRTSETATSTAANLDATLQKLGMRLLRPAVGARGSHCWSYSLVMR